MFSPATTDEMMITVITPITIPRIVSPLRSLLVRSVSSAILTVSCVSAMRITTPFREQGPGIREKVGELHALLFPVTYSLL